MRTMRAPSANGNVLRAWLALVAILTAGCTLNPDIPNARVVCDVDNPHCPAGFLCEPIKMASVPIAVCCRMMGCSEQLAPEEVERIVDGAHPSAVPDSGADAPAAPDDG